MENTIELNGVSVAGAIGKKKSSEPVRRIRSASVNLIRQLPERPGEWGNRIVVVVLAGNKTAEA